MPKQSKPRQPQREKVIEDIVRVNAILRRAVETAARHKGINDLNLAKLRAFVEIVRVGDTPSREELQYFAQGFERFLDERGQESLDKLFGPQKAKQGKKNFFTEWEKLERDCRLLLHVHLAVISGMTKNEATDYVAEHYVAPPIVHGRPVQPRGKYFQPHGLTILLFFLYLWSP